MKTTKLCIVALLILFTQRILYVIPFYNHIYRKIIIFTGLFIVATSFIVVGITFLNALYIAITKKLFRKLVISISLLVILLFIYCLPVYKIRMDLTQIVIDKFICENHEIKNGDTILGGITTGKARYEDDEFTYDKNAPVYINETHCIIVVCNEEFFYCSKDKHPK